MSKMYNLFATKNLPIFIAGGIVLGLGFSFYASNTEKLWFFLLLAFLLLLSCFFVSKERKIAVLAVFISAIIGVCYNVAYTYANITPLQNLYGSEVQFKGVITDFNHADSSPVLVDGKAGDIKCKAYIYVNNFNGDIGDSISFTANVAELEEDPLFPVDSYNYSHGIFVSLSPTSEITVTQGENIGLVYKLRRLSKNMVQKIRLVAGEDAGAVLSAMTCGDTDYISDSLRQMLSRVGIGHVIAVSGLHVSLLVLLVSKIFSLLRIGKIPSFLVCEAFMVAFVLFSGVKVSAVRAFVMISIYLLSKLLKRRYNITNAIAVCVIGMTLCDPMCIGDSSFLLSVAGVFGVGAVSPKVIKAFKIENKLLMAVVVTICAHLCTIPVSVFYFDEISLVSALSNAVLMLPCEIALALCMIFVLGFGASALNILVELASVAVNFVLKCCEFISQIPFTYLTIRHIGFVVAVLISAVLVALCYLIFKRVKIATALCTVLCAVLLISHSVYTQFWQNQTFLRFISNGTDYACIVHKGERGAIISSSGKLSEEVGKIVNKQGITEIDILVSLDNGPHAYGSYSMLSPRQMLLPDPTYVFEPKIPYSVFYDEMEIKLPYADISIDEGDCKIAFENAEITFGKELYDTENSVSVFAGITGVKVNGEDYEIYLNGCDFCLKITENGFSSYPWLK